MVLTRKRVDPPPIRALRGNNRKYYHLAIHRADRRRVAWNSQPESLLRRHDDRSLLLCHSEEPESFSPGVDPHACTFRVGRVWPLRAVVSLTSYQVLS